MKRLVGSTLFVCLVAMQLAACGGSDDEESSTDTTGDASVAGDLTPADDSASQDVSADPDSTAADTAGSDVASEDTATSPDLGVEDTAAAPDVEGVCNNLVPTAATVAQVEIAQDPPVLKGGTIAEGTYVLTKWEKYIGAGETPESSGQSRRDLISFAGNEVQFVVDMPGVAFLTFSFTYATDGNVMTATQTCPDQNQASPNYEATETTFTWLNGKELTSFTKQ